MKLVKGRLPTFILIGITILSFLSMLYLKNVYFSTDLTPKADNFIIQEGTKFILYWLPMWKDKTFSFGSNGYGPFTTCKFKNCFATHDKGMVPMHKFDAIVFHAAQYEPGYEGPIIRTPLQRCVFANMETPVYNYPAHLEMYASFYNWTMTYRRDSDIPMLYGRVIKHTTNYTVPTLAYVENKTRLAVWIVSHCDTKNRREVIYEELRKFFSIDVYGACGNFTCPRETVAFRRPPWPCYDLIERQYKFYLAFENSHCEDYVTEKLYLALQRNIVPIAYGYADYEYYAPPNSVIVADKFQTVQQLANYILYLDKNPERYLKYFEWKKSYSINNYTHQAACKLCRMLNDPLEPQKIYKDIYTWWLGKNHSYCKTIPELANSTLNQETTTLHFHEYKTPT